MDQSIMDIDNQLNDNYEQLNVKHKQLNDKDKQLKDKNKQKQHLKVLRRKERKRRRREMRKQTSEINPLNTCKNFGSTTGQQIQAQSPTASSFENIHSSSTDNPCPVVSSACNYHPYSPLPIWRPRYFAGFHSEPRCNSSFHPGNENTLAYGNTIDNTFCNNENRQDNLQQEEPRSTNSWKPTEDFFNNEVQYEHYMKIVNEYVRSEKMPPDDKHIFLDALQHLSRDYVQRFLKDRDLIKSFGNKNKLKENSDFIMGRLDTMLNVIRSAHEVIGNSKTKLQDALLSSKTDLEAVKNQLVNCNVEIPSVVVDLCDSPSPRFNLDLPSVVVPLCDTPSPRFNLDIPSVVVPLSDLPSPKFNLDIPSVVVPFCDSPSSIFIRDIPSMSSVVGPLCDSPSPRFNLDIPSVSSVVEPLCDSPSPRFNLDIPSVSSVEVTLCDSPSPRFNQDKISPKDEENDEKVPDTANSSVQSSIHTTQQEVHLITAMASFLKTISLPVNLDFIYAYVEKLDNAISKQYIERLLKKYPVIFQEESVAAGQERSEKEYRYIEMKPIITI